MVDLTKISTKGQVVIPRDIREELGIAPGDALQVERVNGVIVLKKLEIKSLKDEVDL